MKKNLLLTAALACAMAASAQMQSMQKVSERMQLPENAKMMKADMQKLSAPVMNKRNRVAPADIARTYIMDANNWDGDFTENTTFSIEAENGSIILDQYENSPKFKYNVKLVDFTYEGAVAYGFFDEETSQILIPVQVISYVDRKDSNGNVFGNILLMGSATPNEDGVRFGAEIYLEVNEDGTIDFAGEVGEEGDTEDITGFLNMLPDYLKGESAWNYGFDCRIFPINSLMTYRATGASFRDDAGEGTSAWGAGTKEIYVEDYGESLVVHNFLGLAPVEIYVNGDGTYSMPCGQFVGDYDYSNEDFEYGCMRIVGGYDIDGQYIGRDPNRESMEGFLYEDKEGNQFIGFYGLEEREDGFYYTNDPFPYFAIATANDTNGAAYQATWVIGLDVYLPATEVDAINGTVARKQQVTKVYNLMGQEVAPSTKGITIRNGKKFILK